MINLFFFIFAGLSITPVHSAEDDCLNQATTIELKLACLEDVEFKEVQSSVHELRHFEIKFKQPTDHDRPQEGSFRQRLVLLHRGADAPMILQTSGYSIFAVRQTQLAHHFKANQLQVEHRFFSDSRPSPLAWDKLNILQSAHDFHRITKAFKKIYSRPWVNTGASKGGMTSLYYRYFYPHDLEGTVADVAPLSFSTDDSRYVDFVRNVGGERFQVCREALKKVQKTLLETKEDFIDELSGNFEKYLQKEAAYEHSVLELPFIFWQYHNPQSLNWGCKRITQLQVPREMFELLKAINPPRNYSDEEVDPFVPYFFQAATELGSPGVDLAGLEDLLNWPIELKMYLPQDIEANHDPNTMKEVLAWAQNEAKNIVYIYGELDPWSAGEFPVSASGSTYKFNLAGGNHGANIFGFPLTKRAEILSIVSTWLQVSAPQSFNSKKEEYLEDIEFKQRKLRKL